MNQLLRNLSLKVLVASIILMIALPTFSAEKKSNKIKKITVTAIDSENSGCGTGGGFFEAKYQGKTIYINFTLRKIVTYVNGTIRSSEEILCRVPREKLSFANKSLEATGYWTKKDSGGMEQFMAEKIIISKAKK